MHNVQLDTSIGNQAQQVTGFAALAQLANLEGIFIKQKFERFEALTGCETPNVYKVYGADREGNKHGHEIFKAKEKSECIQRVCLPGDCREFDLKVKMHTDKYSNDDDGLVMKFHREYKCTWLCFNRPYMEVNLVQGGNKEFIGRIFSPYLCCDSGVIIMGKNDELKYKVMAACCQLGFWCKFPCDACQKICFKVTSPSEEHIGEIWKVSAGFCKACLSPDTDCFKVPFPPNTSPEDKALFLAAVLFIDYRYFEENQNENRAQTSIEINV